MLAREFCGIVVGPDVITFDIAKFGTDDKRKVEKSQQTYRD